VTYNVADSAGNKADPKVRTVNVVAQSAGGGGGGGGGGGSVSLSLFNEKIFALSPTSVRVTWDTNYSADSRVVYGLSTRTIGSAPLYGYAYTTATDTQSVITHSQVITGLATGTTYYFRPVSSSGGSTLVGIELKREEVPAACMYLKEYLRINIPNNPDEVTKLQSFLKSYEGFSGLNVTGRFDETTDAAVRTFQLRYNEDVLAPWNLTDSTGYVYYTTQKKINEIYCQRAFPLNEYQKSEIESFKVLLNQLNQSSAGSRGSVSGGDNVVTLPIVGVNTGSSGVGGGTSGRGEVAGVKTETGEDRMTNVGGSSTPSKIALSDLLATVPNVSSSLSQSHANDGEIGSSTSVDKGDNALTRGLASVSSAARLKFGGVLGAHPMISLALLLLALVLLLLYVRQWRINRKGREGDPLLNI
jgi:peptidoglycan hydrolase-like protein with peptidoglycan-binding domain